MAKTSTERSKLFHKKLREDVEKNSVFKAKDRERKRNERNEKKPLSESELQNPRKKNREKAERKRKPKKQKVAMMITTMCMPIKHLKHLERQLEKSNLSYPNVQEKGRQ